MDFNGDQEDAEKHLYENYTNVESPVSFLSPQKIHQYYNGKLPMGPIKKFLATNESYTLLRPERKPTVHAPTLSFFPGDVLQGDLFFVDKISEHNNGVKYILSIICVHSKYAYLEPMKTKSAKETKEKLGLILQRMPSKPNIMTFDQGSEFKNETVINFLRKLNIRQFFAMGEYKCAVVERFQKTIQKLIYSFLVENETLRFIDVLQNLVANYNSTIHSTISPLTPLDALDIKNVHILEKSHSKNKVLRRIKKVKPKFKKGDRVRISLKKSKFTRSYDIANTYEEFIIEEVLLHRIVPFYILKDLKNRVLSGKFTQNQLQHINLEMHRGNIIAERKRKGKKKEYLMKFKGYDDSFNEWVSETDTKRLNK